MSMELTLTDLGNRADQWPLVAFRLEQQLYALPIEPIEQIIEMVTITPIPQVKHLIEGVINVRGAAVPVVNLRRHLGLLEAPLHLHTPIILVQASGRMVALIVDEVIDVLNLPAHRIARPADFLPEGLEGAPVLQGLAHTLDSMVLLLDPEHLFLPSQAQALAQAMEALPDVAVEEEPEEAPVELSVETRSETMVEEVSEERPADTQPQPARTRRKKRQRAKKEVAEETSSDEPAGEVAT